jgi:hypothetical protein
LRWRHAGLVVASQDRSVRAEHNRYGLPRPWLDSGCMNEDWLAVIVGLAILTLVLVGAIPGSVIP